MNGQRTHRHVWRLASTLLVTAATLVPHVSHADAKAAAETADSLLTDGMHLMARGIYVEACPKIAKSHQLDPQVTTIVLLAECYVEGGQTMSGWIAYKDAAELAAKKHDARREAQARARVAELAPVLAKLNVSVPQASVVEGLVVERDGDVVRSALYDLEVAVDPGRHTIRASAPNRKTWTQVVEAKPKEVALVTIPLLPGGSGSIGAVLPPPPRTLDVPKPLEAQRPVQAPKPSPIAKPEAKPETKPDAKPDAPEARVPEEKPDAPARAPTPAKGERYTPTQKHIALGMGGAGVLGFGLGAVFGLMANSDLSSSNDGHCYMNSCDRAGRELRSSSLSKALISTISFTTGIALLGGGAALWFTASTAFRSPKQAGGARSASSSPMFAICPSFGPQQAGVLANAAW